MTQGNSDRHTRQDSPQEISVDEFAELVIDRTRSAAIVTNVLLHGETWVSEDWRIVARTSPEAILKVGFSQLDQLILKLYAWDGGHGRT